MTKAPEEHKEHADPAPAATGSYYILTWGCQMNVHDSEKLAGLLRQEGYEPAPRARDASLILLNTCAIRVKATEKVFSELGRLRSLREKRPELVIGVCGCVAQQEGERIYERAPHVDFVVGPRATTSVPVALRRVRGDDGTTRRTTDLAHRDDSIRFPFDRIRRQGSVSGKGFVTIIEGCNHRCTFCVVPRTRGRESCRDLDDVLREVRALAEEGRREVEFLGQTVNAYRDAAGHRLADLLWATAKESRIERIRFTTSHPAQMDEQLMDAMAAARPKVCPYLHLPVQSGSSRVLRSMRRGYDRDGYLRCVEKLRRRIPEISLGTDVIVGFPTEDESDFVETMSLLEEVEFDNLYSFTYSPRPGTGAFSLADGIPDGEKLRRLMALQARQNEIQQRLNAGWIGRETVVLVEGASRRDASEWCGRTPENRVVNFAGDSAPGRLERVRITSASAHSLRGDKGASTA